MFAVCELVRFLLANKRETMRCDWLAIVNMVELRSDYTNYTSPFYLCIIHDCTQTDFGRLRFRLRAITEITAEQRRRRLLSRPSPPYCCPTFVGQHLFVVCLRLNVWSQQEGLVAILSDPKHWASWQKKKYYIMLSCSAYGWMQKCSMACFKCETASDLLLTSYYNATTPCFESTGLGNSQRSGFSGITSSPV